MSLDDELELILLGMRLAKAETEKISDSLFSGTIKSLVNLHPDKKKQGLIDWLLLRGAVWDGASPVVDAIVRRVSVIRNRESCVIECMAMVDELASSGAFSGTTELRLARDRLRASLHG